MVCTEPHLWVLHTAASKFPHCPVARPRSRLSPSSLARTRDGRAATDRARRAHIIMAPAPLRATRSLVSQLRIVFAELRAEAHGSLTPQALQAYGRRYAAEMYLCAQRLRDQVAAAAAAGSPASLSLPAVAEPPAEVEAELQRMLWAVCIWELSMVAFVGRPALITEALVPWWQLHLCDRRLAEQELPALLALERPESRTNYWSTLRGLCANGLPDAALRLLKQHSVLRGGGGSSADEQAMLERLETLHHAPGTCSTALPNPEPLRVSNRRHSAPPHATTHRGIQRCGSEE